MFQTIIVGIEGRSQDAEALALAKQLGEPGAEIIAVNIAVMPDGSLSGALAEAEAIIDAFTEPLVKTEGFAASGASVGQGLRTVAAGARADLIVVASSRRGMMGRLFAGDAVRDVLRHAPCPVAVATVGLAPTGPLRRVVVGYDGSAESEAALGAAVGLARRDDATVSVVDVVEPMIQASSIAGSWLGDTLEAQYDVARGQLATIEERFGLHGVIAVGRAGQELREASDGADLLAIGLHELGLIDRLLVGSTDRALLHGHGSPMLFVPPARESEGRPAVADALDSVPETATAATGPGASA